MAVLNKDDFFSRLHAMVGEDTSDESLQFLDDMTDTYNDLQNRAQGDGIDWKQRYEELDENWKKKYKHRFLSGGPIYPPTAQDEDEPARKVTPSNITFSDLFD